MKDFVFLNYNTEYSCSGEFDKTMGVECCFEFVFGRTSERCISEKYEIILYKGIKLAKTKHRSNACLFTKQQIRNHLKQAQGIYPFKFYIIEEDWKKYPVFRVQLLLEDVPGTFHKYILTWLRYMYEYPYNVILLDAYKLKKDSEFRFTSISNLFNLVLGCFEGYLKNAHQIAKDQINKPLRKKEIREKLKSLRMLNSIYTRLKSKNKRDLIPLEIENVNTSDIEYWESNELFEKYRKPIYMNVYKKIIKK